MAKDQEHDHDQEQEVSAVGVANPAVIDLFAVDQKTGEVLLAMHEPRPWDDSDERLHELQEKFNAYVSFLLDGEMVAAHPELAGKSARIELRCDHMPDERALGFAQPDSRPNSSPGNKDGGDRGGARMRR